MRRRIRSAAFPVHRHSVPQLLVDGVLVALAYFLAFRLRFADGYNGGTGKYQHLFNATIWWVVPVALVVLAAFGVYQRLWTFVTQRDYENVAKAVVVTTLLVVGVITRAPSGRAAAADVPGCCTSIQKGSRQSAVGIPASVAGAVLPARARAARRRSVPRPSGRRRAGDEQLPRRQGCPRRADRRRRRRRHARRPRTDPQPAAAAAPGRVRRRRPAQARGQARLRPPRAWARPRPRTSSGCSTRSSPPRS